MVISFTHNDYLFKHDPEPCQSIRIGTERESTILFQQDFADENQADPLTVGFGGKEGGKKFGFGFLVYSFARVGYLEADRIMGGPDMDFSVMSDGLGCIFYDIDKNLFE